MPRVTRAALRSLLPEETNLAASTPLPLTPLAQRAPLGEITGNTVETAVAPNACNQQSKPEKKAPSKGKRGRVKKTKKPEQRSVGEENIDVLEDDNRSATSSAVNEACQELLKGSDGGMKFRYRYGNPIGFNVNCIYRYPSSRHARSPSPHTTFARRQCSQKEIIPGLTITPRP